MRGKLPDWTAPQVIEGITPADAGKTYLYISAVPLLQDHPRGCGENYAIVRTGDYAYGITPADAGKTIIAQKNDCQHEDHPRGCGENSLIQHF